ncbi:trimeric intracellular cation channel family protein [Demequina sp.]|uniref:trimeric intracellular cation channel family protein n=1 Tax=Demequina sp. TaxID=2050685 RepID=UPI003D0A546E
MSLFTYDPDTVDVALGTLRTVLEYVGIVAFAVSGAVAAGKKRMDLVGAMVLASVVAVGGGTMRDLLLNIPVFWLENPIFIVVSAFVGLAVAVYARWHPLDKLTRFRTVQISDAAGLAVFVVVGTGIALDAGASLFVSALLGVVTGVGGGVVRDVLSAEVPEVLRVGTLYATAALAGSASYALLLWAGASRPVVFWVPILVVLVVRLGSLKFGWGVPVIGEKSRKDYR